MAQRARELLAQALVEGAVVGQARERIGGRLLDEDRVGLGVGHRQPDQLGEVVEHALGVGRQRVGRHRGHRDRAPQPAAHAAPASSASSRSPCARRACRPRGDRRARRSPRCRRDACRRRASAAGSSPDASAGPTSFEPRRPPTTADSLLANSTMPQPSTPSRVAMRREASTKTSAGAVPAATAVASSRITACSSETRASSTRPTHDHGRQRGEDEHRAERVRHDALRTSVGVVEQRHLVDRDGADHADGREAAGQEAGRVDDDEDGDLLDRRVEAAGGVDGEGRADQRAERPGRQHPGGQRAPVEDEHAQQPVDDAGRAQRQDERRGASSVVPGSTSRSSA